MTTNELLRLYKEVSNLKELDMSDFVNERLDAVLNDYVKSLDKNCRNIYNSNIITVVKEIGRSGKLS